jgi:hypothetical protein
VMARVDISVETWCADFLARFANVPWNDPAPYQPFANAHGPTLSWLHII